MNYFTNFRTILYRTFFDLKKIQLKKWFDKFFEKISINFLMLSFLKVIKKKKRSLKDHFTIN